MPLPEGAPDLIWPPPEWAPIYEVLARHQAWYSGRPELLSWVYSQLQPQLQQQPGVLKQMVVAIRNFFWGQQMNSPQSRVKLHVPIASDIASMSADLLFSEPAKLVIPEAHRKTAESGAKTAQDRLDELQEEAHLNRVFLEAAEICAAMSGVFLRLGWDRDVVPDHPILSVVPPDQALPEFRWGTLTAVTFWRTVRPPDDELNSTVKYRHLERHEKGVILHALYRGDDDHLGVMVDLATSPETAELQTFTQSGRAISTELDRLTAAYIPNMRPNRSWGGAFEPLGRSDFDGATEGMMDALDEVYTSWIRDVRLARARLIVPSQYLDPVDPSQKGKGATFDPDREIYEALDLPGTAPPITAQQFAIRVAEHQTTATDLIQQIVRSAGYAAASFGLTGEGQAVTATEVKARERRSLVTRNKKSEYWGPALAGILAAYLEADAKVFGGRAGGWVPRVDFADSVQEDVKDIAPSLQQLAQADALSTETKVRMVHPDWTDEEVQEEVDKIQGDTGQQVPDLFAQAPLAPAQPATAGNGNQPPQPPQQQGGQ